MLALLVIGLILPQDATQEPPLLAVGETLEGEIADEDAEVHTPTLDRSYTDAPVVGKSYWIGVESAGPCTIELRSYLFDAYLVLRDEAGGILAEDDDGLLTTDSRIVVELAPGAYPVSVCALHGQRGAFELTFHAGRPRELTPRERAAAEHEELQQRLAFIEEARGPEHPDTATSLNNLARLLYDQGDYAGARPLYERTLAIWEKARGPEHPDTARSLSNLASLLSAQGDYAGARPLLERALAIWEKELGPEHPVTATGVNNLAGLLKEQGDYAGARPYFERALAVREKALGPEHPDTAQSLNNLASLLRAQGDYAGARSLHERALAIREKALGSEHPVVARSLNNLAGLLKDQGDYAGARPLYERALTIREKVLGREHPTTAASLNNLASLLWAQGDYVGARPLYERALGIHEKSFGPEHPDTATSLNNLAVLLKDRGDYAGARPYFERALAIREKALGSEHPDIATSLNNLANLFHDQGDYPHARPLYERALAISENVLGPEHPDTAQAQSNLGTLLADQGLDSEARQHYFSALRSRVRHAEQTLWSLTERERLSFLRLGEETLRHCLSASRPDAGDGDAEGYELSLAWRGLVSRSLLASRAQLVATLPEGAAAALGNLRGVQAELSKLLYATEPPDRERHEREIRALRERRNELELEVQRLAGPAIERPPRLAELERSLVPGSAFLDFLVHPPYEPAELDGERVVRKGEWREERLSAWIVRSDRGLVHLDLGPAAPIEGEVKSWLGEVVSRRGLSTASDAREEGERLRSLLWEPLSKQLDGITRVFVRADSFLGTLPFEVIPLAGVKYLIEEKSFVYVQTPNDLVKEQERYMLSPLLAVGGVDFRRRAGLEPSIAAAPVVASAAPGEELRGSLNQFWSKLPHTENEAQTVIDLHEAAFEKEKRLLLSAEAPTEERLKHELPNHAVVHLATHGFFHPEGTVSMWDGAQAAAEKPEPSGLEQETHALVGQLPGLLTGLVCAGANEPAPAGRDDGLLTAEEVLWLDLSNVELVVLSACETALGERRSGEGMIGLRRAFGLAGAKTVVSSLWSVKDRSTSDLMQRFYENLWRKHQGRADALRNAQLEILAKNRATDGDPLPSTWGAFVLSGEWR